MNTALKALEQASLGVMAQVLLQSQALPLNTARSAEQINQAQGTAPRHAWVVQRWLAALARAGAVHTDGEHFRWRAVPSQAEPQALPALYAALGFPSDMARLHTEVIGNLPDLLRDHIDLPRLLLQGGDPVAVLSAYQHNHFTSAINETLAARAREVTRHCAALKVLELGGGAGCSTRAVLDALDECAKDYRFTDVSPLFVRAAQRQFRLEPGLRVHLLDLDYGFDSQGVEPHSLDLVIAGNVLHNARDIAYSLGQIRRALREGGTLLFSESVSDNTAMLTFMHLLLSPPAHAPLRTSDEVFMAPDAWRQALRAQGFELLDVWPPASDPLAAGGQHLFQAKGV